MSYEPELRPCPFCGNEKVRLDSVGICGIYCSGCESFTTFEDITNDKSPTDEEYQVAGWNSRQEDVLYFSVKEKLPKDHKVVWGGYWFNDHFYADRCYYSREVEHWYWDVEHVTRPIIEFWRELPLPPTMKKKEMNDHVLDYQDEKGEWHIMCACGHTISGSVRPGDKIELCPNCRWQARFGKSIEMVYEDRLPDEIRAEIVKRETK